jgi:phosphoglycolate phosphatase-like HAD superfamily hydrolase
MTIKTVLFDFDGTIADTFDLLITIYNSIAPKLHCKKLDRKDIPTLQASRPQVFFREYNVSIWKLPFLLYLGQKEMKKCIDSITPIDGMIEALHALKKAGFTLGIVTSNSQENVLSFLKKHEISPLFSFVYSGKSLFGKDKTFKKVFKEQSLDPSAVIYVGDETRDIEAAKKFGIPIISVSWGFNSRAILETLKPDVVVDKAEELVGYLQ